MPQAGPASSQKLVTELKVSGHLMTLDKGLFCVFHAPGSTASDPQTGLPGVRITHPPMQDKSRLTISSFNEDGWIGAEASAALVRVNEGPSQLLVTIYQNGVGQHEAPKLQVMRLGDVPAGAVVQATVAAPPVTAASQTPPTVVEGDVAPKPPAEAAEVAAHVQRRGDKLGKLGEWMGEPGSQSWIEGFAIAPNRLIGLEDIEYQAVLGKGWLSPWSEGGQYCGSRGMALPILGLRVRLKGKATATHTLRISASFTDGTRIGPIADTETAEAESLAPLEAFRIEILAQDAASPASIEEDDDSDGNVSLAAPQTLPLKPVAAGRRAPPVAQAAPVKAAVLAKPAGTLLSKLSGKPSVAKPAAGKPARPTRR